MRNIFILIFVAFTQGALAEQELVVVAKPIATVLSETSCDDYIEKVPDSKYQEICMDRVFNVKYDIIEVLSGGYKGNMLEAIDFYHYSGLPDHMIVDPACVTLRKEKGYFVHLQTDAVKKINGNYSCVTTVE